MAIWIGNTHLTGTTEVDIGGTPSTVYIGDFLTYPEGTISYTFSDIKRSSNLDIPAAGTTANTRWVTADVTIKRGSTVVATYDDVTLTPHRVSGDTTYFHITANNEIWADYRGSTTGGMRSAYFTFSYNNVNVPEAAGTFTQAENQRYSAQETLGLTAYTTNNYYYGGGDYYLPCNRRYASWDYYSSGYRTSTANTTEVVTAMTYDIDYHTCNWMSSAATEGVGWPRKLVMDHNYATGATGNRTATITVMYPVNGSWSDYNYVTASTTITQFGANYSSFEYRINSITPRQMTWAGNVSGTAYTANAEVEAQYRQTTNYGVTGTTGWTTTTGNWITYTGRPDMCGNQKPMGTTSGYYFYYLENGENTGAPYGELYYPTTSTTIGTIGVYPTQTNGSSSNKTQQMDIVFGDATSSFTLTQLGVVNISVSPTTWSAPSAQTTTALTVSSNVTGWGCSASTSWLHTSISGNTINVTADTSTEVTSARTGAISVYYSGTVYATCNVTQAKAVNYVFSALTGTTATISSSDTSFVLEVVSKNGNVAVPLTTNNVYIGSNTMNVGWNTAYGPIVPGGGQVGHYVLLFSCSTNSSTSQRSVQITATQPESLQELTFTVTQARTAPTAREVTTIQTVSTGSNEMAIRVSNTGNTSATTVTFYYCFYDTDPEVSSNWHSYTVSRIAPGSYVDCIKTSTAGSYTHIPYAGPYNGKYDWTASWTT